MGGSLAWREMEEEERNSSTWKQPERKSALRWKDEAFCFNTFLMSE